MNIPTDQHGSGQPANDPSLTPEERDLALRLSRLGGQREPAPALDAKILAAAHGALQVTASRQRRVRSRWPVAIGIAASLVLAVGIAWRLRPLPNADIEYSEAPAAAQVSTGAASAMDPPAQDNVDQTASAEDAELRPPGALDEPAEMARSPEREMKKEAADAAAVAADPGFVLQPEGADIVFDKPALLGDTEAAPQSMPQLSAPPPPSPAAAPDFVPSTPAPAATAGAAAKQSETRQLRANGSLRGSDAAAEAEDASTLDRIETTGARIRRDEGRFEDQPLEDQPLDEQPPVSADSPLVQQAWLQRIRELVARGKLADARASLAEYHRRYPQQPLPDDLRALER